ncbi:hypothetical protein AYI70_g2788, partial [Smittium culicis]
MAYLPLK